MKESLKRFLLSNWTLSEKGLLLTDLLLLGVLIGWITSPLKHGFGFFSNNSWDIKTNYADESEKEEEE
jgi:hypothetical protein